MKSNVFAASIRCTLLCLAAFNLVGQADDWRDRIDPFIQKHCIGCHDDSSAEGGLDLSSLGTDLNNPELMRKWVLVHDRIASGEMPPKDEARPSEKAKSHLLSSMRERLRKASREKSDVVLRRLNRTEYENTVNDLFGIDVLVKDLLPKDTSTNGFDNVGQGLAVSPEAAQAYLRAADKVLDAVFGAAKKTRYIKHETNLLDQKTHDGKPYLANQIGKMFRKTDEGLVIFQSGYCPTNLVNFARLRPPAGTYRGTLKVRAVQSKKPVTLRIYGGDTIVGRREKHLVGYFDVPPDKWTTITFTDRLVEGGGTYQPKCYGTKDTRKDADTYPEPGIEIGDITIEGPLEKWPPPSRAMLLEGVSLESGTLDDAKKILTRILPRAFRRKTETADVNPFLTLVESAISKGRSFEDALRLGIKGVLCSPEFLFLDEPGRGSIDQYAVASRLSYFLWSSMPDSELMKLADMGKLADPETLKGQVERLLKNPKSKEFTSNFVGQWLNLREIDFTSPDKNLYPEFDELLKVSSVEETQRFFQEVLDHDLSLINFVDSDFAILNGRLATHYGITGIQGQAFRKVVLPPSSVRGGILTHASVLKITANGTTTSPVLRGAWVMDKILGETVPPPPANVPAVEPDIRGATTLREQLAKHRDADSCATCHNKIDPAGFALENFDVIGGWRDKYRTLGEGQRPSFSRDPITFAWVRYRIGLPVDASGVTPQGKKFKDIREFKKLLLSDKESIAAGLTRKLATYALGRRIGFSDRQDIEEIVTKLAKMNYGFRSLVHELVQSEMFRRP